MSKSRPCRCEQTGAQDDVKFLALTIRRGLLLIVRGIETKYGTGGKDDRRDAA